MSEPLGASTIAAVIAGMALANFAVRFIPLAMLSRISLPPLVMRWLSFVPIAVMGALVAGEVMRPNGAWSTPFANPSLWAAILTALVFKYTRSFLGATVAGMAAYVAFRALMG